MSGVKTRKTARRRVVPSARDGFDREAVHLEELAKTPVREHSLVLPRLHLEPTLRAMNGHGISQTETLPGDVRK